MIGVLYPPLPVQPREGFKRHWFKNYGDRVSMAKAAGYSHVVEGGVVVMRPAGTYGGGDIDAFLMEIPLDKIPC